MHDLSHNIEIGRSMLHLGLYEHIYVYTCSFLQSAMDQTDVGFKGPSMVLLSGLSVSRTHAVADVKMLE